MPNDKQAPWSTGPGSRHPTASAPRPPRALNPETGETIPRFTLKQKLTLKAMEKILAFLSSWIIRYIALGVSTAGLLWEATPEQNSAVTNWLGGGVIFLLATGLRWIKLYYLKLTGKKKAPATLAILFLCGALYQIQSSAADAYQARLESRVAA